MPVKFSQTFSTAKDCAVTLAISVSMPEQSGNNVAEVLYALTERPNIRKIHLLLTGELQFHWLKLEHLTDESAAMVKAMQMDEAWLKENKEVIENFSRIAESKNITFNIITWSLYKHDKSYQKKYHGYGSLIRQEYLNPTQSKWLKFKANVEDLVLKHPKYREYVQYLEPNLVKEALADYILEESAMLVFRMSIAEADHEIYMGRRSSAMSVAASIFKPQFAVFHKKLLSSIDASITPAHTYGTSGSPSFYSHYAHTSSSIVPAMPSTIGSDRPDLSMVYQMLRSLEMPELVQVMSLLAMLMQEGVSKEKGTSYTASSVPVAMYSPSLPPTKVEEPLTTSLTAQPRTPTRVSTPTS